MNQRVLFLLLPMLVLTMSFAMASDQASSNQTADVAGKWQISWQARLGTDQATVHLQQSGEKLTGTFQDVHGSEPLTGSVRDKQILFEVEFKGPRPFTIGFSGKVDGEKMTGISQAKHVGTEGAYLGHGGEVVQPEHPWTGQRAANQTTQSHETNASPPAIN